MNGLLVQIAPWHWMAVGVVLMLAELVVPGAFMLWLGLAALATGIVAWGAGDLGWQGQGLVFLLATAAALGLSLWRRRRAGGDAAAHLNQGGDRLLGRRGTLVTPLHNGRGRAEIEGTTWPVAGPDLPAGARVEVFGRDGADLLVRPAAEASQSTGA